MDESNLLRIVRERVGYDIPNGYYQLKEVELKDVELWLLTIRQHKTGEKYIDISIDKVMEKAINDCFFYTFRFGEGYFNSRDIQHDIIKDNQNFGISFDFDTIIEREINECYFSIDKTHYHNCISFKIFNIKYNDDFKKEFEKIVAEEIESSYKKLKELKKSLTIKENQENLERLYPELLRLNFEMKEVGLRYMDKKDKEYFQSIKKEFSKSFNKIKAEIYKENLRPNGVHKYISIMYDIINNKEK
jgi:hypothetical protein